MPRPRSAQVDDALPLPGGGGRGALAGGLGTGPPLREVKIKRKYHLHAALWVYSLVAMLIAIGAFNSQNNLLFWLFGLALSLMLVSGLISGTMMMGLRVERLPIDDTTAGEALVIRYVVSNRNRVVPAFALTLTEIMDRPAPPAGKRGRLSFSPARQPKPGKPALPRAALDAEPVGFVPHVPPRGRVNAQVVARAASRGRLHSKGLRITTSFPFGIIRKSVEFIVPGGCVVRPAPAPLPDGVLHPTRGFAPGVLPQPRTPGGGDEFLALRPYQPGDSPRMIAWKPSARSGMGELLVRQTAAPMPLRTWVVLELLAPHTAAQRERAISLAAGAVMAAHDQGRSVGLLVPAYGLNAPARRGGWHVASILNDLALVPLAGEPATQPHGGAPLSRGEARAAIVVHAGEAQGAGDAAGAVHLLAGPDAAPPGLAGAAARGEAA